MTDATRQIMEQALSLPDHDRAFIAERLIASLDRDAADEGVEEAWQEEIARRLATLDRGEAVCLPWEEVRERIRGKLRAQA